MGGFSGINRNLNLNITATGAEKLTDVQAAVQKIGTSAKVSEGDLRVLESVLQADVKAGNSLGEALKAVSQSSDFFTKGVRDAAKSLADAEKAQTSFRQHSTVAAADVSKATRSIEADLQRQAKAHKDLLAQISQGVQNPFGAISGGVSAALKELGPLGISILGVGTASVLAGRQVYEFVHAQAEAAQESNNLAIRLDISNAQLLTLSNRAKVIGLDIHNLTSAERFLANALEDSGGAGKKSGDALRSLGIGLHDASGGAREFGPVLLEVFDRLSQIPSATERMAKAADILGRNAAKSIQPYLVNLDRLKEVVHEANASQGEQIQQLARTEEEFRKLDLALTEFKRNAAAKIAPIIVPIIRTITDVIKGDPNTGKARGTNVGDNTASPDKTYFQVLGVDPSQLAQKRAQDLMSAQIDYFLKDQEDANKRGADGFRKVLAASKEGMEAKAKELKEEVRKLDSTLSDASLDNNLRPDLQRKRASDLAEIDSIEAKLKATGKYKQMLESLTEAKKRADEALQASEDNPFGKLERELEDALRKAGGDAKLRQLALDTFLVNGQVELNKLTDAANKSGDALEKALGKFEGITDPKVLERLQGIASPELLKNPKRLILPKDAGPVSPGYFDADVEAGLKAQDTFVKKFLENRRVIEAARAEDERRTLSRRTEIASLSGDTRDPLAGFTAALAIRQHSAEVERSAALYVASLQEDTAKRNDEITKANRDYRIQTEDIVYDLTLKRLELERQKTEEARNLDARFYDSLFGGRAGLAGFFKDQLKDLGRGVFVNAAQDITKNGIAAITPGGQRDAQGNLTTLGKLLSGTILGDRTLPSVTTLNTKATELNTSVIVENTTAHKKLTEVISVMISGGGTTELAGAGIPASLPERSAAADILKLVNSSITAGLGSGGLGSVFGGQVGNSAIFNALGGTSGLAGILSGGIGGLAKGSSLDALLYGATKLPGGGYQSVTTAERLGAGIGVAGTIGAGALGIFSGIRQGGARGINAAVGSALGTAAALDQEPISKAALAIGAAVSGLVGSLLPDPKQQRRDEIAHELQANKYYAPNGVNLEETTNGKSFGYNYRGQLREYQDSPYIRNGTQTVGFDPFNSSRTIDAPTRTVGYQPAPPPQIVIHMPITAMDSRSFLDRAHEITNAVRKAVTDGHAINTNIQRIADRS